MGAFLEGLSRDLELSVHNLEELAFKTGAPDSAIAVAAREASSAQEVVLKRLSNCRNKMKPFLFSRLPSGERPPFKKVRSFVRQTTPGSDKPGLRRESSEFTLLIEDKEMKNTVTRPWTSFSKTGGRRRRTRVGGATGRCAKSCQHGLTAGSWTPAATHGPTWSALQPLRLWANPRATFATCNLPRRRPPESAKGGPEE